MGLLSQGMDSLSMRSGKSRRTSNASALSQSSPGGKDGGETQIDDGDPNDTSTLDKEEGNILMALISQLRPGMDLSKIALPTFVLEPRSLLERITDFFSHPELIFGAGAEPDAKQRFLRVMTYYLSGWHIKPKGVKKPYNPVLGEFFRCSYTYGDGTEGFYVAEQVSHHPPVSAFFYVSPKNGLLVTGELKPKSKFLGNSAATIMEGEDRIRLLDRPEDGEYVITMPNTYARGILFGKMLLELCDLSTVDCQATEYHADVDFKAKGWISGGYNVISGKVTGPGRTDVGDLSGHWSSAMEFTDKKTKEKKVVFDPARAKTAPKNVLPESEQEEYESRRLWSKLTDAIRTADMHGATAAKSAVEDHQRELVKKREAAGEGPPESRFFKHVAGDKWMPKLDVNNLPKDRQEMEDKVRQWIFGDKSPTKSTPSASTTSSPQVSAARRKSSVPADATFTAAAVAPTASSPTASAKRSSTAGSVGGDSASVQSFETANSTAEPPSTETVPGPPAPGPKFDHPVSPK
ncbi:oxysterol-binding protein family [Kwoniella heveanensis BCC8398]|uniref:Oxysterol-binding protein family n=1 Tax=Kwoniella heveanensis BCC8398 TaxID=1296120 RepID=A0A1B9H3L4_9TREE|nr:oxysterol-binding protein family [Kwoniella heveanensis BCC8398]